MIIITLNGDNNLNRLEQSDTYTYSPENRYNLSCEKKVKLNLSGTVPDRENGEINQFNCKTTENI